jgi:hypothetical protein
MNFGWGLCRNLHLISWFKIISTRDPPSFEIFHNQIFIHLFYKTTFSLSLNGQLSPKRLK